MEIQDFVFYEKAVYYQQKNYFFAVLGGVMAGWDAELNEAVSNSPTNKIKVGLELSFTLSD